MFVHHNLWLHQLQKGHRSVCYPSPCGPNAQCCFQNYIGVPPNCRPECVLSSECPSDRACINRKCRDPCPGSCGTNANCHVLNHLPIGTCLERFEGDPFVQCTARVATCST